MRCNHNDCFTCPYSDCISNYEPANTPKKKCGRKRLPPEVIREHRIQYQRKYNAAHKAEHAAYYKANAEKIKEKQWAKRDAQAKGKLIKIWVTNGTENRRTLLSKLEEYESMGWYRGRS